MGHAVTPFLNHEKAASEKADAVLHVFAFFVVVVVIIIFYDVITPKTNWLQDYLFFHTKSLEYCILTVTW